MCDKYNKYCTKPEIVWLVTKNITSCFYLCAEITTKSTLLELLIFYRSLYYTKGIELYFTKLKILKSSSH